MSDTQPVWPQPPPAKKKRHWVRNSLAVIGGMVLLVIVISLFAGHSSSSPAAPASPATSSAPASPAVQSAASVGSTFKAADSNGNVYDVTLRKVIDPAPPASQFDTASSGKHLVAAVFQITGVSGTASDDANGNATLVGTNQQVYQFALQNAAGYTNFSAGDYNVSPGQSETGAVVFEVPDGVGTHSIQWSDGGLGGAVVGAWKAG